MSKFSVWGSVSEEESKEEAARLKEEAQEKRQGDKVRKSNVMVTAKIRKLMLRLELWNIYEKVFLGDCPPGNNKNREAARLLDQVLEGQPNAQQRIATIFSSDSTIENWESVLSKLRYFENESDTIPFVATEDSKIPMTEISVDVRTSDDSFVKSTVLDYLSDPYQLACEIQVEHGLPPDEIDYIQGLLQHEMLGLMRQGMSDQREKLKSIQKKTAIIEHLVMLNENISMRFSKTTKMYNTSSDHLKSSAAGASGSNNFQSPSGSKTIASKNRTLVHFNKLIIDERRKLDQIEQEIAKLFKKMGKMSAADYYKPTGDIPIFTNGKTIPTDSKAGKSKSATSSTPPAVSKTGNRRTSVSLRSALMQQPVISLNEDDEEDEECDSFGTPGPMTSTVMSPQSKFESPDEEEELNTFGLSDHEIEKKMLFRKSEKDRKFLVAENKRLRDIINSVDITVNDTTSREPLAKSNGIESLNGEHIKDVSNADDGDLRSLINELNAWDIERDELDGQIDNLNDKKEELKRKLQKQKEKKEKKLEEIEQAKLFYSLNS